MIVDKKGDLFEDRRKTHTDRRKNTENAIGGKEKKIEEKKAISKEANNESVFTACTGVLCKLY